MRKLIRRTLPALVLGVVYSVRNAYVFWRTPAVKISGTSLPSAADVSFADMFEDDLDGEWEADNRAIGEVFEYERKLQAVSPLDRRALWYMVRRLEPRSVLEVGTHIGGSLAHIAMAMKKIGGGGGMSSRLVAVDAVDVNDAAVERWRQFGSAMSPRDMLERLGCADGVEFVVSRSLDYLAGRDGEFDFVFLDGNHLPHIVYREIPMALRALRPGGYLVMHDYFPGLKPLPGYVGVTSGPYRAVERLRREGNGVVALPLGLLPWGNGSRADITSLAVLARDDGGDG